MLNYETLNAFLDFGKLNAILLYFGVIGWLVWKVINWKPHKDLEDLIKKELLQRYYLMRQLKFEQSKRKRNLKKEKYLIEKLDENSKKLEYAKSLFEVYGKDNER